MRRVKLEYMGGSVSSILVGQFEIHGWVKSKYIECTN